MNKKTFVVFVLVGLRAGAHRTGNGNRLGLLACLHRGGYYARHRKGGGVDSGPGDPRRRACDGFRRDVGGAIFGRWHRPAVGLWRRALCVRSERWGDRVLLRLPVWRRDGAGKMPALPGERYRCAACLLADRRRVRSQRALSIVGYTGGRKRLSWPGRLMRATDRNVCPTLTTASSTSRQTTGVVEVIDS